MTTVKDTLRLSINVGTQHVEGGVGGSILISTTQPETTGAGCTVYLFNNGKLTGTDVLFEITENNHTKTDRVRVHSDLSPLDHVCVDAIIQHYDGRPPNEVFCTLEKLDSSSVRNLSAVTVKPSEDIKDVEADVVAVPQLVIDDSTNQ